MPGTLGLRLPVRAQLLIDVVLIVLFFALDTRDLVFKTAWLGPSDSYSFSTTSGPLRLARAPLVPTVTNLSSPDPVWSVQSLSQPPRAASGSGWASFLQKCARLHALAPVESSTFSHVVATNCHVGRRDEKVLIPQLVLTSSVRVDSVAWAACKLLFHHRKPPICHAPIVRLFGHRYNMDDKPSRIRVDHQTGDISRPTSDEAQGAYSARPGSKAETEIMELLNVISKSSPLASVVCVEGFAPVSGPGYYTTSLVGCGSPTYNHSSFVGHFAKGFLQYHQDKAWLTADMLHVSGMTYMIRENRRSVFLLQGSDNLVTLEHRTLLNFSSFGALYTVATSIDFVLIVVHVLSAMEIMTLMLWPVWKSLASGNTVVSRSNAKVAFAADDCQAVLTASLYRSKPIVLLLAVAHSLHWTTVVPNSIVLSESGISMGASVHAALSLFRFWVLVLLTLHTLWDAFVTCWERRAFQFVHGTYITIGEVAFITGIIGFLRRSMIFTLPTAKYAAEGQRLVDATTFLGHTAVSNAFPEHHDSLQNTSWAVVSLMYGPLVGTIGWSLVAIACFLGLRFVYFRVWHSDTLKEIHTLRPRASSKFSVAPDLQVESIEPPPRPASPKRLASEVAGDSPVLPTSSHEFALRLPLEKVVDVPIRARSLVRNSRKMEKKVGHQIFLRPPQYLEHGIILQGGCLKTRLGFTDIVHPYLRADNHAMPSDESSHRTSTSGSSSPRRLSSFEKLQRDAHTLRLPAVPLR